MSLYIDLTEFLMCPIRTGIQRVVGEICRHLPSQSAVPVRLISGAYMELSPEVIRLIADYFSNGYSDARDFHRLGTPNRNSIVAFSEDDKVLVPEVFFQAERITFFRGMPKQDFERHHFLVYDLLPLTHPEYFVRDMPIGDIFGYFRIIQRARNSAFISNYTREAYHRRLKRTGDRDGVVLHLGADALGPRPERKQLRHPPAFSVIGTIEPRKNHELILDTFEPLLREIDGLSLTFMGAMGWVPAEFRQRVQKLAADPDSGFTFVETPTDAAIRRCIEDSRATIYISSVEGYGLPLVESLWLGTPVIASNTIPSLEDTGKMGVHIVDPLAVTGLRRAILAFLDENYANLKREEAAKLRLTTWRSFTEALLEWCAPQSKTFSAVR